MRQRRAISDAARAYRFLTAVLERTPAAADRAELNRVLTLRGDDAGALSDVLARFGGSVQDNGLERFLTATRRRNFLIPPRRHRAFPLTELAL